MNTDFDRPEYAALHVHQLTMTSKLGRHAEPKALDAALAVC